MNRRGQRRRLPPTPNKPSTLQTRPTNINFPKLNTSPTYVSIVENRDWGKCFFLIKFEIEIIS